MDRKTWIRIDLLAALGALCLGLGSCTDEKPTQSDTPTVRFMADGKLVHTIRGNAPAPEAPPKRGLHGRMGRVSI